MFVYFFEESFLLVIYWEVCYTFMRHVDSALVVHNVAEWFETTQSTVGTKRDGRMSRPSPGLGKSGFSSLVGQTSDVKLILVAS